MFRTGFPSIIRSLVLYTQHQCSILIPLASSQLNLYDIHVLLFIQQQTPDDGQKTCPKRVEFYFKNIFKKLVYLVGFVIRINGIEGNFFTNKVVSTERKSTFDSCTVVQDCNKKAEGIESLSTTKVVLQKKSSILHVQLHFIKCGGYLTH